METLPSYASVNIYRDGDLTCGDDDLPVFRCVCEGATGHGDGVLLGGHTMLVILAVN